MESRRTLPAVRAGEYEALPDKVSIGQLLGLAAVTHCLGGYFLLPSFPTAHLIGS